MNLTRDGGGALAALLLGFVDAIICHKILIIRWVLFSLAEIIEPIYTNRCVKQSTTKKINRKKNKQPVRKVTPESETDNN
jgi:hypothetical protein